jgi:ankyrin repeat protein
MASPRPKKIQMRRKPVLTQAQVKARAIRQLRTAARRGDIEEATSLIADGADVNAKDHFGDTPLHAAGSDINMVKLLIANGADVNAKDRKGRTPLIRALNLRSAEAAKFLIANGADIKVQDEHGETPLHLAFGPRSMAGLFSRPNIDLIELLIEKGIDVNVRSSTGNTPLHRAVQHGYLDQVECLMNKGADVSAKNDSGVTPLHPAAGYGNNNIVELLLKKGADINAMDEDGQTPLYCAVKGGYKTTVRLLIDNGARVDFNDKPGKSPVDIAIKEDRRKIVEALVAGSKNVTIQMAVYVGDVEKAGELIESGADINVRDERGRTLLHFAALNGHNDVARLLLTKGADVNATDEIGFTPIHCAALKGHKELVELFIANGADVNAKTADSPEMDYTTYLGTDYIALLPGSTPLHFAMRYPDIAIVLINNGADIKAKYEHFGGDLFEIAFIYGNKEVIDLFIAKGSNVNIHQAASLGDLERVKSLVETGIDINTEESKWRKNSDTPLFIAVGAGHKEVAEFLIANGANMEAIDYKDHTPLQRMVELGRTDMAEFLVKKGANLKVKSESGRTLLHFACYYGYRDIAELLLANGADLNIRSEDKNALHYASYCGHKDMVELLLANGADVNAKNGAGKTALDYASEAGFVDIVEALGGDANEPLLKDKGPRTIIVTEPPTVRKFLRFQGIDFDDAWIPQKRDLEGLDVVLKSYLEKRTSPGTTVLFDRPFVLANLRRYNREYSGFTRDGVKYIICQMVFWGGMSNSFVAKAGRDFSIIFDGGAAIVRVIFEADSKNIVKIECNGVS